MRIKTSTLLISALILVSLMPLAMAADGQAMAKPRDIDTVNSDTRVSRDELVGDIDTVNGDVDIATGGATGKIDTVNGDISTGDNVRTGTIDTVNGDIDGGRNVTIDGDFDTVNGDLKLLEGSQITGGVDTVNGDLDLTSTTIKRDVETVNGDIFLKGASHIEGRIYVHKNKGASWCVFKCKENRPVIEISAQSSVNEIVLEKEVELRIADGAKVGKIEKRYE